MNWDIALDKDRKFFRWQNMVITAKLYIHSPKVTWPRNGDNGICSFYGQ